MAQPNNKKLNSVGKNDNPTTAGNTSEHQPHPTGCRCPNHKLSSHALAHLSGRPIEEQNKDAMLQQTELAQAIHRGLEELGVDPSCIDDGRLAWEGYGMLPMERFVMDKGDCKILEASEKDHKGKDGEEVTEKEE